MELPNSVILLLHITPPLITARGERQLEEYSANGILEYYDYIKEKKSKRGDVLAVSANAASRICFELQSNSCSACRASAGDRLSALYVAMIFIRPFVLAKCRVLSYRYYF